MSIVQVAQQGKEYVVMDGGVSVPNLKFPSRGLAVKAAIDYKANS